MNPHSRHYSRQPKDSQLESAWPVCLVCGRRSQLIARHLGVCGPCIRCRPEQAQKHVQAAQAEARHVFDLPATPPRAPDGVTCGLCAHDCRIAEGEVGYCGLRTVRHGRLVHLAGTSQRGILHWYRDPLPTNCVAMEVCGGQGHWGQHNLAVFYGSCVLNCLYCQNWHYRDMLPTAQEIRNSQGNRQDDIASSLARRSMSAAELASVANARTFCVCYFGGDPASQMPHALASAALLADQNVAICWETSGNAHPRLMDKAVQLALRSGGTVKFDLKALDDNLHRALTGSSNRQVLENFARAAERVTERPRPPLVVASTLLVPGYVDVAEVGHIAQFIAGFDPHIPYALLGFAPSFFFSDLPCTSVRHAEDAKKAAQAAGLTKVRLGNRHLLSRDY